MNELNFSGGSLSVWIHLPSVTAATRRILVEAPRLTDCVFNYIIAPFEL